MVVRPRRLRGRLHATSTPAIARSGAVPPPAPGAVSTPSTSLLSPSSRMLMKHRLVHDFAAVLVAARAVRASSRPAGRLHRERRHWVGHGAPRAAGAARPEPGHVRDEPGRPVPRALLGGALRRGQRRPSWPSTSRSSGSCSDRTGRTPRASHTRATSSRTSRRSRSTTSARSWRKTPAAHAHMNETGGTDTVTTTQDLETTQQLNHIEMVYRPGERALDLCPKPPGMRHRQRRGSGCSRSLIHRSVMHATTCATPRR